MNNTITFHEDQWSKIVSFLCTCPEVNVGRETACLRFLEGVHWILRSGAQWRLLPKEYGHWNSVYKRFARWCDQDIWHAIHQHFTGDLDMENVLLDSTVVRAHPCAVGALKKNGSQATQALGRSRGGFSTKIHVNVDALGNPLRFLLTAGQRHDITQVVVLITYYEFERLIANRSYDADHFLQVLADKEAEAVIPPRRNRKETRDYDRHLCKERYLVECFFNKIKHYRRIFSRFDTLANQYLGFLSFAGAFIWLR